MIRWAAVTSGIALLALLPVVWYARHIFSRLREREGERRARFRAGLVFVRLLSIEASFAPLLWHMARVTSFTSFAEVTLVLVAGCVVLAPCFLLTWIVLSIAARVSVPAGDNPARVPVVEIVLCTLGWLAGIYLFRLLPLFAGESGVRPSLFDAWFSRML